MKKGCLIGGIVGLLALVAIVLIWVIDLNNKIKKEDQSVQKQWSNVENTYQKRADLIDQTVSTVKGAANFEQSTLTEVINARAKATSTQVNINDASDLTPENIEKFQQAQDQLGGALSRLLVTIEKYPELKAVQNFSNLQTTVESMESEILFERRKYNDAAENFNKMIVTFPESFVANFIGAKEKGYFKATAGTENAPKIDFSN